jgi:hypothetical protein
MFTLAMEALLYALGELESFNSIIEVKRPKVQLVDHAGKFVKTVLGPLMIRSSSKAIWSLRPSYPTPCVAEQLLEATRVLSDETGEIEVTASGTYLQSGHPDVLIRLRDYLSGETTAITPNEDALSKLPLFSQNVGRIYEAFADGKISKHLNWSHAILRHRLVEEIYQRE